MAITPEKQHGRTYTPPEIARFLSDQLCQTPPSDPTALVRILDPSCGDGALLLALTSALLKRGYQNIHLYGIDNESWAIEQARSHLEKTFGETVSLHLKVQNYVQWITPYLQGDETIFFDLIITNPPYVRTQYQGALESVQRKMKELRLKGDLFLLFLQTLPLALKPDGRLGGIVSNKLLQTKECRGVRQYLLSRYQIEGLWDLGDTKLFEAHVLPLLFLLSNKKPSKMTQMTTVYESRGKQTTRRVTRLNDLLVSEGCFEFEARCFDVNQGFLRSTNGIWTIENDRICRWRSRVEGHTAFRLQDCGTIRNGLKTTANKVFIRHLDVPVWEQQSFSSLELVFPLVVTKDAKAYRADKPSAWVLYPHDADGSLLSLEGYPLSKRYLKMHYQTLSARSYVEKEKWYKHHVGQSWAVFRQPKLIWKEISQAPEVWLDQEGALVDGSLFFFVSSANVRGDGWEPSEWMLFLLAYLNSSFVGVFLRVSSNEKLYSDKMRCNKKNMGALPIPSVSREDASILLHWTRMLLKKDCAETRARIDLWVWKRFGFSGYENPLHLSTPAEDSMDGSYRER